MMIPVIHKDIVQCTEDFLVHQTNCVTPKAKGLSSHIFSRFPEADVYASRVKRDLPGTIVVRGKVINLMGQYYPGTPKWKNDRSEDRRRYFMRGLEAIAALDGISSLAIPWQIGCGLAGGDWKEYKEILEKWATQHPHIRCRFYKV